MRGILVAALAAAAMTTAGAAPAAADDASLGRVLNGPSCDFKPALERFERATENAQLGDTPQQMRRGLQPLRRATSGLKGSLQRCAGVIRRQRPSTPNGETAQPLLAEGLLTMRDGLDVYGVFLELVDAATRAQSAAEARRILRPLPAVLGTFRRIFGRGATMVEDAARIVRRG